MKKLTALLLAAPLAITGCSTTSNNTQPAAQSVAAQTSTTSTKATVHSIDEAVKNGGVTLTVTKVQELDQITLDQEGVKKGAGTPETVTSPNGGKLIQVDTHLRNDGKTSWDLACDYVLDAIIIDSEKREYKDWHKATNRVPGNPECSQKIGPGFETNYALVFEVPTSFSLDGAVLAFFDPEENYGKDSYIWLK